MKPSPLFLAVCCLVAVPALAQRDTPLEGASFLDAAGPVGDVAAFTSNLVATTTSALPTFGGLITYERAQSLLDQFPLRWDLDSLLTSAIEAGIDIPNAGAEGLEDLLRRATVMGTPLRLEMLMELPDLQGYEPSVYPKLEEFLQLVVAHARSAIRLGSHPADKVWSFLDYVTTRAAELARHLPPYFFKGGNIEELLKFDSDTIIKNALEMLTGIPTRFPGDIVDLSKLIEVDLEWLGPKGAILYNPASLTKLPYGSLDELTKLIMKMFHTLRPVGKDDLQKTFPALGVHAVIEAMEMFLNDYILPAYKTAIGPWTKIADGFTGYIDAFTHFIASMTAEGAKVFLQLGDELPGRSDLVAYFEKVTASLFADASKLIPTCDRFLPKSFEWSLCDLFFSQTFGPKARRRLMYDPSKPPSKTRAGEVTIMQTGIESVPTLISAAIQPISIGHDLLKPLADIFMGDSHHKKVEYTDLELDTFLKEVLAPFVHMMQELAATFHKILAAGGYSCGKADCETEKHVFEHLMSINVVEGFKLLQPAAGYSTKVASDLYHFMTRLAKELFYEAKSYAESFPKLPVLPPPPPKVPVLQPLDALKHLDDLAAHIAGELTKPIGGGGTVLAGFFKTANGKTVEYLDMFVKELVKAFQPVSKLFKGGFYEIASINFISHEGGKMLRDFRRYFDLSGPIDEKSRASYLRDVAAAIIKDAQLRIPTIEHLVDGFDKGLFKLFQDALKGGYEITPSLLTGLPKPVMDLLSPDEWGSFLQHILAPFLELLRLGGDRHHKEAGPDLSKVFDDYLPKLAVDGYHVLLGQLTKTFTAMLPAAISMPPLLKEIQQLITNLAKEWLAIAEHFVGAFSKLPFLPPMLPHVPDLLNVDDYFKGFLSLIPPPPPGFPKGLPIYNPFEDLLVVPSKIAGWLVGIGGQIPLPTIPFLDVLTYGGSIVAPDIPFLKEFTEILSGFAHNGAGLLTGKWLAGFKKFMAVPEKIIKFAIDFLVKVAHMVTSQMALFDPQQYRGYIDMVATFAYGNLNKLITYLTDLGLPGLDKATGDIRAFIENIITHTIEEPANYIMSMTRELLGAFLYRFDELVHPDYDDFEKLVKDTIDKTTVRDSDIDKVIKGMLGTTPSLSLDTKALTDLRQEVTAFFETIVTQRGKMGAAFNTKRQRRLQVARAVAVSTNALSALSGLTDDYLIRRASTALQSTMFSLAEPLMWGFDRAIAQTPLGALANVALATPLPGLVATGLTPFTGLGAPLTAAQKGAEAALHLFGEAAALFSPLPKGYPHLLSGITEAATSIFDPTSLLPMLSQTTMIDELLGGMGLQAGASILKSLTSGIPTLPLSIANIPLLGGAGGLGGLLELPASFAKTATSLLDAVTPVEMVALVQMFLKPSSFTGHGLAHTVGGLLGDLPKRLDDLGWQGDKKTLGDRIDRFVSIVAGRKETYDKEHKNEPAKVHAFGDWMFLRTLVEANRMALYLIANPDVAIKTIDEYFTQTADSLFKEGVHFMDSWSSPFFSGNRLFYESIDWGKIISLPGGIENIAEAGARLGLFK
ncbi:unnamed protein product [Vitrella brassicaformis CCMP3155]|uniref:Uncharacterized protein n=1 Tax=Vitrella brassicaformis (strain CCMP3155) TaxID=1169540 RepID=A0A0G4ESW7_VITBC|nr:unnamed protein product [Vitrella brassicaformis CCMP3155]|eukprot:CEM00975.1 unnamed protein product [Vitrella brassicaformis CCMP3155]